MRGLRVLIWGLCVGLAACSSASTGCLGCAGSRWVEQGNTPYTRCEQVPVAGGDERRLVGALRIERHGRELTVQSASGHLEIAAFAGPAPGQLGDAVDLLKRAPAPDLALLIGGVGDDGAVVADTLSQLAGLPFPSLILPGGRDPLHVLEECWEALSDSQRARIWLLTGHHVLRLADHEFVLVAGAEGGRYGLHEDTCGFDEKSLKHLAEQVADAAPAGGRWLLSWTAPAGNHAQAVARTPSGLDVGSPALAHFAHQVGAQGGLFAWPVVRAAEPLQAGDAGAGVASAAGFMAVVPRLGGPALERADGSHVSPGYLRVRLQTDGLRYLGMSAARTLPH